MATEIIKEIDSYDSKYHLKIGSLFFLCLILIFFLLKNMNRNDSIPFVATFNYVEGINIDSEVQLAGIKIGDINKINLSEDEVVINGYIDKKYNIPEDSIVKIKSNGIFGKKVMSMNQALVNILTSLKINIFLMKHRTHILLILF